MQILNVDEISLLAVEAKKIPLGQWAQKNPAHIEEAGRLLRNVRLELFSFAELTDLKYSVESFAGLSVKVREQFSIEIAAALRKKISVESMQGIAVARSGKAVQLLSDSQTEIISDGQTARKEYEEYSEWWEASFTLRKLLMLCCVRA